MADLTTVNVPVDVGLTDVADSAVAAASGGDTAEVGPGLFLYINNGDASPHTVTIAVPREVSGLPVDDAEIVVANATHGLIPLTNLSRGANGRAAITYDAVTSVTVVVLRLGTA